MLQELCTEIVAWSCRSLIEESHQPSIRYLLEWLTVRILLSQPELQDDFFKSMQKVWRQCSALTMTLMTDMLDWQAAETRQGSVTSYIAMLSLWVQGKIEQLGNTASREDVATLVERASQLILPWSMAQLYNLRLYAQVITASIRLKHSPRHIVMWFHHQVALMRVWSLSEEAGLSEVVNKYSPLVAGLKTSLELGNGVKNALRLQDDFYFSCFKPIAHFTLEVRSKTNSSVSSTIVTLYLCNSLLAASKSLVI